MAAAVPVSLSDSIEVTPRPDVWVLEIHWVGGAWTRHTLLTDAGLRGQLLEAFILIRDRFAAGVSAPTISEELNARHISQARGPWKIHRVRNAIADIQRGRIEGVEPLPRRQSMTPRILALAAAGLTEAEIVSQLLREGAVSLRCRKVTIEAVKSALRRGSRTTRSGDSHQAPSRRRD